MLANSSTNFQLHVQFKKIKLVQLKRKFNQHFSCYLDSLIKLI